MKKQLIWNPLNLMQKRIPCWASDDNLIKRIHSVHKELNEAKITEVYKALGKKEFSKALDFV